MFKHYPSLIRCLLAGLLTAGFLHASGSFAESASSENQSENEWSPVSAGPLTTWTAPVNSKGQMIIQPFYYYSHSKGEFDENGSSELLEHGDASTQHLQSLFVSYGITGRLEIDGQASYAENYLNEEGQTGYAHGWTDSTLDLRYAAIEERGLVPAITPMVQLKIPTGKYQHPDPDKFGADLMGSISGGGSYDTGFGFAVTKKLKPFIVSADTIYSIPMETTVDGVRTHYANYVNYDFSAEYFLPKGFNLMFELNGFDQGKRKEEGAFVPGSRTSYFTAAPGFGWSCEKVQTLFVYSKVLSGKNTEITESFAATVVVPFQLGH